MRSRAEGPGARGARARRVIPSTGRRRGGSTARESLPATLRRRLAAGALAIAVALAFAGCAAPAPRPSREVARLAALAGEAEVRREPRYLVLAAPAAREHMSSGWGEAGKLGGSRVIWSEGDASLLTFFLANPRDLRLSLRGAAAQGDGPLAVTVELNGREAGRLALGPSLADHALRVPAALLVSGENRLRLVYPRAGEGGAARRRAAWESLALSGVAAGEASAIANGDELVVSPGSEVAFYLELPPGGRLRVDPGALQGQAGALAVWSESERARPRQLARLRRSGEGIDLGLNDGLPGLVRVALRGVPDEQGRVGVLRLAGARVLAEGPPAAAARAPGTSDEASKVAPPALSPAPRGASADPPPAAGAPRPNVLLFLVDTLRADRLAAYGGDGRLTPHADGFAAAATVYETAVAQAPWTRPAVASIFTGLWPQDHGTWSLHSVLPESAVTLAELLREAGYRTAAVSTNGHITARHGFAQGFDDFHFLVHGEQEVERVVEWTGDWLEDQDERPFLLYLHTIDPHGPYAAPRAYRERFAPGSLGEDPKALLARAEEATGTERERLVERLRPLYDAEVAYNDAGFGALLALLERRGLLEDALVVFVADHGEEFLDHGELGHGWNFHAETLRVPLLVKYPRQRAGRREPAVAQQVDLLPTLTAAAGARTPAGLPGRDLRRALAAGEEPLAVSHLDHRGRRGHSLVRGGWKLVMPETRALAPGPQLHAVERGRTARETPGQELRHPLRVRQLAHLLRRELGRERATLARQTRELDAETRAELEALGYL